jgi:hypothetical protein
MRHTFPYNIEFLKNAFVKSSDIFQECLDNLKNPNRNENFENYLISLYFIRFRYNFKAISELLSHYEENSYFKIPIYLILRTCLSDILTYFYFLHIINSNSSNTLQINSKISGYLVDHLHRLKNDIVKKVDDGKISKEEFNEYWTLVKRLFPEFLDSNSELIKKEFPSFTKINCILKDNNQLKWITDAYDYYEYLSKFEHIGVLTNELQEFHKIQEDFDDKGIILSFSLLINGLDSLVISLDHKTINEKWQELKEYVKKI